MIWSASALGAVPVEVVGVAENEFLDRAEVTFGSVQVLHLRENARVPALDQDGSERSNREVTEITDSVDLSCWPRAIAADVRPRTSAPGAQLSFKRLGPDIQVVREQHDLQPQAA